MAWSSAISMIKRDIDDSVFVPSSIKYYKTLVIVKVVKRGINKGETLRYVLEPKQKRRD